MVYGTCVASAGTNGSASSKQTISQKYNIARPQSDMEEMPGL